MFAVIQAFVFCVTGAVVFVGALQFGYPKLANSSSYTVPAYVFSATVSISYLLAQLALCEVINLFESTARYYLWEATVDSILCLLTVVVPVVALWYSFDAFVPTSWLHVVVVVVTYALGMFAFFHIALPFDFDTITSESATWGESMVARVAVVGVISMALLSGIGTVSAPFASFVYKPRQVSQQDLDRLQNSIDATDSMIASKRESLRVVHQQLKSRNEQEPSSNRMMRAMKSFLGNDSISREIAALQTEIGALERMKSSLLGDLDSMNSRYRAQLYASTAGGQVMDLFQKAFALYCVYRIINSFVIRNPFIMRWSQSQTSSDPVVLTMAHLMHSFFPQWGQVEAWTRQLGFLFSGVVFVASITSVVSTYQLVRRAMQTWMVTTPSPVPSSSPVSPLLMAMVLGTYAISTCLILRSNLPPEISSAITKALGAPLDNGLVQALFDTVFFLSSMAAVVVLTIVSRIKMQEEDDLEAGMKYE